MTPISYVSQCNIQLFSLEQSLHSGEDLSPEKQHLLQAALEKIHTTLATFEKKIDEIDLFVRPALKELRSRVITLYGEIDTACVKHTLHEIEQESLDLESSIQKRDLSSLSQKVNHLKSHIATLFHSHAPLLTDRRVLARASLTIGNALAAIKGEATFDPFVDLNPSSYLDVEEALLAIVDLLSRNAASARQRFSQLSPAEQKLLLGYLSPEDPLVGELTGTLPAPTPFALFRERV